MRIPVLARNARASALGLLAGSIVPVLVVLVGAPAIAQRADVSPQAILEATHLPPLLALQGERITLAFDVHCARAGVEDPEVGCEPRGTVFLHSGTTGAFRPVPMESAVTDGMRQLRAVVPD